MTSRRRTRHHDTFGLDGDPETGPEREEDGDAHHHEGAGTNDHLASIYESRTEQLEAVVPFVQQGLERGERCLYVADDNSTEAVLTALREGGIDVEGARESGALSIHTKADTYLRPDEFETDAMLDFWEETLAEARDEDGYEGVRAAAEMTWALETDTDLDTLAEYEALLNPLYEDDDYVVLCQYNRDRFPTAVVHDVIKTHPYLVCDGTVSENAYYTPPETFFGTEAPEEKVDRMIRTLRERTEAKAELETHERYLRELYETTANNDLSFEGAVERLLELGCERLDADGGALTHLSSGDGEFRADVALGPGMPDGPGVLPVQPDEDCFCRLAITRDEPTAVPDVVDAGWDDDPLFQEFGAATYFGIRVTAGGEPYGTFWFYETSPRGEPFTDNEETYLELMGQWVSTELERTDRNRAQRELYEITADGDLGFEEKVDRLIELGRDRFGLDVGVLTRDEDDELTIVKAGGDIDVEEGVTSVDPHTGQFCRRSMVTDGPVGAPDTEAAGWDDDPLYRHFGLNSYLGTGVTVDGDVHGTLCFADRDVRNRSFTDAQRTLLDLMGQWVGTELERQQYERELEETVDRLQQSNERLEQFAYAASHDLQEPLRMVSSYLQLIETRYEAELDEDGEEYLEFAVDGANRMREMIEGLLEYSRIETRGDPFEPVDLDPVLEDVLTDLQFQVEETDATVEVEDLPRVQGDESQLHQLLQNLLSNAIEYTGDAPPVVHVSARREGDEHVISVRDEGIGVDPDDTDRIFQVFQRLHTQEEFEGTGIGLAICKRIVDRHGGDIWVDSEPGEGSTFSVTLPVDSEDE